MALFRLVGAPLRRTELIWPRSRRWPLATGCLISRYVDGIVGALTA
jgi:hypothetical protein